jgi:glycyl-tRNA synthetase beta chain
MNILKGAAPSGAVDPALLSEPEERELHRAATELGERCGRSLAAGDHRATMECLLDLRDPIDRFFDKVLVMDPDERVRANRLALLQEIAGLFLRFADLSKVVLEGEKA